MRTIIDLTDDQINALKVICERKGISRAEAIRCAVDKLVEEEDADREARQKAIDAAFGIWKDRGIDTDTYLAELRSEWDR